MRILLFLIVLTQLCFANADQWQKVYTHYDNGDYEKVIVLLDRIKSKTLKDTKVKGLVHYLKALSYSRLFEYEKSLKHFEKALKYKYENPEIYYEYGQLLYTANRLKEARNIFKKSVEKKFKVAVSLYYIASISEDLKDYKTAASFYAAVKKVDSPDKNKILQAAMARIGDIYLLQARKQSNASEVIENYVIPQYEKAVAVNTKTELASEIRNKIEELQRRYELVLFNLRNGRPTARPPYFYKMNLLTGYNTNVNELDDDSLDTLDEEDHKTFYNTVSFFGRYTFYPNSSYSLSPQINAGYTKYNSSSDSIKVLNNYFVTTTLQASLEHFYKKKAATFYVNYDYTYIADDSDANDELEKSSTTQSVTFSEQLQFWENNPTIFRYRYSNIGAEDEASNSVSHSFIFEQMWNTKALMYYFYLKYAMNTYENNENQDGSDILLRTDFIFSSYKGLTPNFYYARTIKNFNEEVTVDRSYNTFGLNLSKNLSKHWYAYVDYSLSMGESSIEGEDFSSQLIQLNIDYVF